MPNASKFPWSTRAAVRSVAVVIGLALAGAASARNAGNAVLGHVVARAWCVNCHVVDTEQASATAAGPPTFAAIALLPTSNPRSLRAFLMAPHPPMPDFQLSNDQIDDLSAYILSLKRR